MKLSKEDYDVISKALHAKGFTPERDSENSVFTALEACGFQVEIKKKIYDGIKVSRVIALMHELKDKKAVLKL